MALDPYGFRSENEERPAPGDSGWFAGISTLAWSAFALFVCAGCSGIMAFAEDRPEDQWYDKVGVWLLLVSPAAFLGGIAVATATLHGVARRWWTAAGPNVVIGGCGGCFVWLVGFVGWLIFAVMMDS